MFYHLNTGIGSRVSDPHPFHADPGRGFEINTDPGPDSELDFFQKVKKELCIPIQGLQKCGAAQDPDTKPCAVGIYNYAF